MLEVVEFGPWLLRCSEAKEEKHTQREGLCDGKDTQTKAECQQGQTLETPAMAGDPGWLAPREAKRRAQTLPESLL